MNRERIDLWMKSTTAIFRLLAERVDVPFPGYDIETDLLEKWIGDVFTKTNERIQKGDADTARLDWAEKNRADVYSVVESEFDLDKIPALLRFSVNVDHYKTRVGGGFVSVTGDAADIRAAFDDAMKRDQE